MDAISSVMVLDGYFAGVTLIQMYRLLYTPHNPYMFSLGSIVLALNYAQPNAMGTGFVMVVAIC